MKTLAYFLDSVMARRPYLQMAWAEIVTAVIHHPSCWQIIKERAIRLCNKLETEIIAATFESAQERGKAVFIEEFVVKILTES